MRKAVPFSASPARHALTAIPGLRAAGVSAGIKVRGAPDLALLVADAPMHAWGVFTQNHFAAAPVRQSQRHLEKSNGLVRAIVVNSGNANACTGTVGSQDALTMCAEVAVRIGCPLEQVLVCSTGVIGVKLPMPKVLAGIDAAFATLADTPEAGRAFLRAIMTTDAFPKEASEVSGGATWAGVAKGAGMIDPAMATMLAFMATDAAIPVPALREGLPRLAAESFNAIHVDSHASTNDSFLVLSSGAVPVQGDWVDLAAGVARRLAWLIVRDGEGATKVTAIVVRGARDGDAARAIARRIGTSALVRTALYGNDPNWGRITSAVGNAPEVNDASSLRCHIQGVEVFAGGEPQTFDRDALSRALAVEEVELRITLEEGGGRAHLLTSDLGHDYVDINAMYTS